MSIKMNCFDCKQRFNMTTREPIMMFCCGETACRECVTTKMIKSRHNAEKGIAQKGEFECSGCHKQYYNSFETDYPVPIQPNNMVKTLLG